MILKKYFVVSVTFIVLLLTLPHPVSAHLAGQPPFFLINGKYSSYYPIYVSSLKDFLLPQDSAPENYLVNQPLSFEIDQQMLPYPEDVLGKIIYMWDFGDGTKTTGVKTEHSYTKMGSYLLTIHADFGGYSDANTKSLIQAILINILPKSSYRLPKAIISVNDKKITDPTTQSVTITSHPVSLDARNSESGSAPIVTYMWDLGDGKKSEESNIKHTYSDQNQLYIFPFLRVKDRNGFISDTYVQFNKTVSSPKSNETNSSSLPLILGLLGINILIITIVITLLKKR